MSRDELVADVKWAVKVAREAMEEDAAEARSRGWGSPSPDAAAVGTLAAGILIAKAVRSEREALERIGAAPRPRRSRTSRTAA